MNIVIDTQPPSLTFKDLKEGDLFQLKGESDIRLKVRVAYSVGSNAEFGSVFLGNSNSSAVYYSTDVSRNYREVVLLNHTLTISGAKS